MNKQKKTLIPQPPAVTWRTTLTKSPRLLCILFATLDLIVAPPSDVVRVASYSPLNSLCPIVRLPAIRRSQCCTKSLITISPNIFYRRTQKITHFVFTYVMMSGEATCSNEIGPVVPPILSLTVVPCLGNLRQTRRYPGGAGEGGALRIGVGLWENQTRRPNFVPHKTGTYARVADNQLRVDNTVVVSVVILMVGGSENISEYYAPRWHYCCAFATFPPY